jgi:hypothetical protein
VIRHYIDRRRDRLLSGVMPAGLHLDDVELQRLAALVSTMFNVQVGSIQQDRQGHHHHMVRLTLAKAADVCRVKAMSRHYRFCFQRDCTVATAVVLGGGVDALLALPAGYFEIRFSMAAIVRVEGQRS